MIHDHKKIESNNENLVKESDELNNNDSIISNQEELIQTIQDLEQSAQIEPKKEVIELKNLIETVLLFDESKYETVQNIQQPLALNRLKENNDRFIKVKSNENKLINNMKEIRIENSAQFLLQHVQVQSSNIEVNSVDVKISKPVNTKQQKLQQRKKKRINEVENNRNDTSLPNNNEIISNSNADKNESTNENNCVTKSSLNEKTRELQKGKLKIYHF
jgi:hypothetical protein